MPFRSRLKHWKAMSVVLLAVAATTLAGCGTSSTPSILDTHGPIAEREAGLFWVILGIAGFVFVVVSSALLYSVFRFRARPDSPAPRQIHGNTTIEIAWTVVPSVILFLVLGVTIFNMFQLAQPSTTNTLTVRAIGHQWWWEFQYPGQNITTADEMHIPTNTVVHLELVSDNVIHSFWVPQLGGKTDVIPGHDNTMWLQASDTGQYRGECAEFCGVQHAHMDFLVVAESSDAFNNWVTGQQQQAATPTDALALQGQKVFAGRCGSCHLIDGVNQKLQVQIGPNLTHFGSRSLIAGGVLDNTPQNLNAWITDAQAVKPGSDMPTGTSLKLTSSDVSALVAYLEGLK